MSPRTLLHLEGASVLAVSLLAYQWAHGSWLLFAILFLAPDLSMLGYLANGRAGAIFYNLIHTYVLPLLLAGYAAATDHHTTLLIALIWIAHIGMDRALGFGLKYPTHFKDTHLNPARHTAGATMQP